MPTTTDKQREVVQAIRQFLLEVTVLINPANDPKRLGSGVLLHREDGTPFVLTAAHVVIEEPWSPCAVGVANPRINVRDAVKAVHLAPQHRSGRVFDVAIVELTREAGRCFERVGASITCLETDREVIQDDTLFLTGYQSELVRLTGNERIDDDGSIVRGVSIVNLVYETRSRGRDHQERLLVDWGEAIVTSEGPPLPYTQRRDGEHVAMGSPVGVSGAGLWRFEKPLSTEVWSPRKHGHLVGINSAWNSINTEYVELLGQHDIWLRKIIAEL